MSDLDPTLVLIQININAVVQTWRGKLKGGGVK